MKLTYDMRVCKGKCGSDIRAERIICRGCFARFCRHSVHIDHTTKICVTCKAEGVTAKDSPTTGNAA